MIFFLGDLCVVMFALGGFVEHLSTTGHQPGLHLKTKVLQIPLSEERESGEFNEKSTISEC